MSRIFLKFFEKLFSSARHGVEGVLHAADRPVNAPANLLLPGLHADPQAGARRHSHGQAQAEVASGAHGHVSFP